MPNKHVDSDALENPTPPSSDSDVTDSLDGALPPKSAREIDTTQELVEPIDDKEAPKQTINKGLSKWGPWRRFMQFRDYQREQFDHILQEHDQKDNIRGKLPKDEHIQVPAIWVAELYTPSNIDGLFQGIRKLGWEQGRIRQDDLLKWMSDVRQGRRAGWTSLGLVSTPQKANLMSERTAQLPTGVSASLPFLMSLTPSITALIMVFILDDEASNSLDGSLSAIYTTRITIGHHLFSWQSIFYILMNTNMPFRRSYHDPDSQRMAAVQSSLGDIEKSCVSWIHKNLPGVFSTEIRGQMSPTAMLLVTEATAPLSKESRSIWALRGLMLDREFEAWKSDEWPHARLILPRSWGEEEGLRLTFACRRRDAFQDNSGYPDPTSNWTIAQRADEKIRGLLSRWALTCMLDGYHERLSELRDKSAARHIYRPIRDLKKFRNLVRSRLYDILTSTHEIEKFTDADLAYRDNVLEMEYVRSPKEKQTDLLSHLQLSQRMRAKQVRREANLLQSVLSVGSEVSQTIASIRIQRFVVLLTLVSISIALLALSVAEQGAP
ncbi:hypothetical protein HQ531_14350 [bacterium]|nr:hypothetical protein [bacterium]